MIEDVENIQEIKRTGRIKIKHLPTLLFILIALPFAFLDWLGKKISNITIFKFRKVK